jgi:ABC-type transporter Mla subunit MlaD
MDFEEKIDALRMNLELASHDIESLRVTIDGLVKTTDGLVKTTDGLVKATDGLVKATDGLVKATDNLVKTVNSQQDDLQTLKKISGDLVRIADVHDRRIAALERRA